jgi:hypothetical protein
VGLSMFSQFQYMYCRSSCLKSPKGESVGLPVFSQFQYMYCRSGGLKSPKGECGSVCVLPVSVHVLPKRWSEVSQRRVCGSVCVLPVLVHVLPKRWSEVSQSRQTVKYRHESLRTWNQESLCWRDQQQFTELGWTVPPSSLDNGFVNHFLKINL